MNASGSTLLRIKHQGEKNSLNIEQRSVYIFTSLPSLWHKMQETTSTVKIFYNPVTVRTMVAIDGGGQLVLRKTYS